jgi:hypothetical protein
MLPGSLLTNSLDLAQRRKITYRSARRYKPSALRDSRRISRACPNVRSKFQVECW